MRRVFIGILVVVAIVAGTVTARQARPQDVELAAAARLETVDGDLDGAIARYQAIAERYRTSDRATVATALLQLAEIHRKRGDAGESTRYFQRVVEGFPDQGGPAAIARARLGGAVPAAPMIGSLLAPTLKKVYTGSFQAIVSPDGRYLAHDDWPRGGTLRLRDLATGSEISYDSTAFDVVFSRDSSQVAYSWVRPGSAFEVRVVPVQGPKPAAPKTVLSHDAYVGPADWSPDGRLMAAYVQRRNDRVLQFGLIGVSDGTFRVLKTVEWGGTIGARFSPDGRDIAFDERVTDDAGRRDIRLMATDASREVALVTGPGDDFVLGWTPDGTHLLFGSNRTGTVSVMAQRVVDRQAVGSPTVVMPDVGVDVSPAGMTNAGAVFLGVRTRTRTIEVVPVDLVAGREAGPPARPVRAVAESHSLPEWSPNGRSLAYLTHRGGQLILGIRTLASGAERELHLGSTLDLVSSRISWAPDDGFVVYGRDLRGRYGVFRIDGAEGRVTLLHLRGPQGRAGLEGFAWSADGTKMYYRAATSGLGGIVEHDVATGAERTRIDGQFRSMSLSPDGRWFGVTRGNALWLIPHSGGSERELLSGTIVAQQWTPDGQALLATRQDSSEANELWLVPIDGRAPRKIDVPARGGIDARLSPDGRQMAYSVGGDIGEVLAVENVLSHVGATR